MAPPRLILTGASGFLGRHLLELLKEQFEILCLARRSQARCGAPFHPNIQWFQVDIADQNTLAAVFRDIKEGGGAEIVLHLAAHYDFTGEKHPEYYRTNYHGLRNILDQSREINIKHFIFSSSVAACAFPPEGEALNEQSPPDGDHIYARTKALGEAMLNQYRQNFPSVIVRFAALVSDWCEYPPLYMFLRTWLSSAWNSRILGGSGESAIPYLHVRDAVSFLLRLIDRIDQMKHGEIVIASPNGAVSHRELYIAATHYYFENARMPLYIPKPLVGPGIKVNGLLGRFMREKPFEKPWMGKYVDKKLTVDASHSMARLDWQPRMRLDILRRLPFLLENLKAYPVEWTHRNRDAMKLVRERPNLKVHSLLGKHHHEMSAAFTKVLTEGGASGQFPSYQRVDESEHRWNHRLVLRHLMNAVRTRERALFISYCQDLAERRMEQGFTSEELCGALGELNRIVIETLMADPEAHDVLPYLHDHITTTVRFGCDQVQETYELAEERRVRQRR
jgi:nucleoside-diphosphate-sugar epimerase